MLGQSTAANIFQVNTATAYSSSDFNGFRPNPGAATSFAWNVGPPPAARAKPVPGSATFAEYVKATGNDRNSVLLDYDIFVNVPKLDRDPKTVQRLYDFRTLDFSLKPGSTAIDRGVSLANVNDGFSGKAPDLGALEVGQPLPIYGPRPLAR